MTTLRQVSPSVAVNSGFAPVVKTEPSPKLTLPEVPTSTSSSVSTPVHVTEATSARATSVSAPFVFPPLPSGYELPPSGRFLPPMMARRDIAKLVHKPAKSLIQEVERQLVASSVAGARVLTQVEKLPISARPLLYHAEYTAKHPDTEPRDATRHLPVALQTLESDHSCGAAQGVSASDALRAFFTGETLTHCTEVMQALWYKAVLDVVGPYRFDFVFDREGPCPLRIGQKVPLNPISYFISHPDETANPGKLGARPMRVGDWTNLGGVTGYLERHPLGAAGNWNVCLVEDSQEHGQKYCGFGIGDALVEQDVLDRMIHDYRLEPTAAEAEIFDERGVTPRGADEGTAVGFKPNRIFRLDAERVAQLAACNVPGPSASDSERSQALADLEAFRSTAAACNSAELQRMLFAAMSAARSTSASSQ